MFAPLHHAISKEVTELLDRAIPKEQVEKCQTRKRGSVILLRCWPKRRDIHQLPALEPKLKAIGVSADLERSGVTHRDRRCQPSFEGRSNGPEEGSDVRNAEVPGIWRGIPSK